MARRFKRGLNYIPVNTPIEVPPQKSFKNDELLILILLFILLAASPSLGINSSYFFIIIMAVIGVGGVGKAFGLKSQELTT